MRDDRRIALAAIVASGINTAYGMWVTWSALDETAALLPFAFIACGGFILTVVGLRRGLAYTAAGLILQAAAPTAFAWIGSLLLGIAGIVLACVIARRTRTRR